MGFPYHVVSVDIGGTKIAYALLTYTAPSEYPTLSCKGEVPTNAQAGGNAVRETIGKVVQDVMATADVTIDGVGIGSAGVVDSVTGDIVSANDIMPGWGGQKLGAYIHEVTGLPVTVMGDVHAHALGEARWGAGKGQSSCLVAGIGTGLGGAFVDQGVVAAGAHGVAGHIGHIMHPEAVGITCACGRDGHLESIASGSGIIAGYKKLCPERCGEGVDGRVISERAHAGEYEACEVIERAGRSLGESLGSLANTLDPAVIILSGSVVKAGPLWEKALHAGYESQALDPVLDCPIVEGSLGSEAPLVGAAENLLDKITH